MNLPFIGKPVPRMTVYDEIALVIKEAHQECRNEDAQRRAANRHFAETKWPEWQKAWFAFVDAKRTNPNMI